MRFLILECYIFLDSPIKAQEKLGLRTDNYSGIHGILLNPCHNVSSLFRQDLNLTSVGASAQTNYSFVKNTNVFCTIQNSKNLTLEQDVKNSNSNKSGHLVTNFNGNKKLKYISFLDNPMTSSFIVKLNNSHSLGFFTILNSVVASHIITCV